MTGQGDPDDADGRDDATDAGTGGTDGADTDASDSGAGDDGSPDHGDADRGTRDASGPDEQYCASCGEVIKKRAEICPHCGVRNWAGGGGKNSKDRATAGILAILLGFVGTHKFYLGETELGILYLCFFWTGIPAVLGLIEGILYLTKTDEEFQRQYVDA